MYEEETEQLKKVMKDHGTPKSVPLTCDKCYYESEVSFKGWDEINWHSFIFPVIVFLGGIGGTYAMFLEIRQTKPKKTID
jgi:hypothetical protein